MEPKIQYNYIYFNFDWSWLKDKQIIHRGNKSNGVLVIMDADGNTIKMYGYELIG